MDMNKFNRTVQLVCPSCGCAELHEPLENNNDIITCASCGRAMSRVELEDGNSESISATIDEMAQEVTDYAKAEVKKMLEKSFSKFGNIKIR
ncbi:hypothetical protein [uncultured Desulfovibrio sp.]|uniref:ECs_2282 family putative zinc-binding protein n=1 Tax=Desulfovibrio sp. TaxID=885 RepID=UPI00262490AB|nr:hypothetical protein [uncultured Desulfovibrio sp.]